jgi:hypothetical protein
MANHGVMFGWNRPVIGREAMAGELFQESMNYWSQQVEKGVIESVEPILMEPHGGDLNGFFLVRGDLDKINAMLETEEHKKLIMRVDHSIQNFGMVRTVHGEELMKQMGWWQEMVSASR